MPRVPTHTVDDAPEVSRATLTRLAATQGKVINILASMAHAPVLLELYDRTEQLLREQSSLDEPTRQAIHLTVSNVNGCDYCQAAYTIAAVSAGFSRPETTHLRRGRLPGDETLTSLLAVCRQIATNTGHVDDATWQAALNAGWSSSELLEGYAEVVRTILTNYFNHLVDTEVDLPAAPNLHA